MTKHQSRRDAVRAQWRARTARYETSHPAQKRTRTIRRKYGITDAQYDAMIAMSGGVCWICGKAPREGKRLHIDHDHATGRVRGLLCWWCNAKVLGRGRERPDVHERAAAYLRSAFDGRLLLTPPELQPA